MVAARIRCSRMIFELIAPKSIQSTAHRPCDRARWCDTSSHANRGHPTERPGIVHRNWAIQRQTREEVAGPLCTYCREHLPARDWRRNDTDTTAISTHEIQCDDCFLVMTAGSMCDETGRIDEAV